MPAIIRGAQDGFQKNLVLLKKPDKIKYKIGEVLDFSGIKLGIEFNGRTREITLDKITFNPQPRNIVTKEMSEIVTISYKEYSNSEPITIPLLITKIQFSSLVVTKTPFTTLYYDEEEFKWDETKRTTGLSIMYDDGSIEPFVGNITGHDLENLKFLSRDELYHVDIHLSTDYMVDGVLQKALLQIYISNKPKILSPGLIRESSDWIYAIKMIEAHERGVINIKDYWKVGDTITIDLSEKQIPGWPQTVTLLIQGFDFNIYGTVANVIFGMKQVVNIGDRVMNQQVYGYGVNISFTGRLGVTYGGVAEFISRFPQKFQDYMKTFTLWYTMDKNDNVFMTPLVTLHSATGKMMPYSRVLMYGQTRDAAESIYVGPNAMMSSEEWNRIDARNKANNDILYGRNGRPPISQLPYFKISSNRIKYKYDGTSAFYALLDLTHINGSSGMHPVPSGPISFYGPECGSDGIVTLGDSYFFCL